MKKLFLFVVLFLSACAPSDSFVQTAIANTQLANPTATITDTLLPTLTPSATLTSTVTLTPTDTLPPTITFTPTISLTPTATQTKTLVPTLTPLPSRLSAGWRDYSTAGFSIGLPEHWKAIEIDKEGVDAIFSQLEMLNTDWARNMQAMFTSEALLKTMKFWAMDDKPAGSGFASVNVTYTAMPYEAESEELCLQLPAAYRQMGIQVNSTQCGLVINEIDTGLFEVEMVTGPFVIKEHQYFYLKGRDMWTLTLAVDNTQWSKYSALFEDIANSFIID